MREGTRGQVSPVERDGIFGGDIKLEVSDPHQVYALLARMQEMHILDQGEIDRFVSRFLQANQRADERPVLEGIVRQTVERFRTALTEEQQEEFRQLLASFLRFYAFISQVIALEDSDLEKMYLFGSWLKRLLPSREAPQGGDVTDDMLELQAFRLSEGEVVDASLEATEAKPLSPIDRFGANPFTEEERRTLSEIIKRSTTGTPRTSPKRITSASRQ